MFVYPSLSRSLIPELAILFLAIVVSLYCIIKQEWLIRFKMNWFIIVWITYIVAHFVFTYPHEQYKTSYLVISLLFNVVVSASLCHRLVSRTQCENIVVTVIIIHIIFVIMQWIGIVKSGNEYFALTGSNENPNVTSLYLAGCIPLIVSRIYQGRNRVFYSLLLCGCIVTIAVLRCRSAYIGLSMELLTAIVMLFRKRRGSVCNSYKPLLFLVAIPIVITVGIKLYGMKRDSADGRLLIWKISSEMIIDKPQGHGYGLFEKYYNLRQATYFEEGNGTDREKQLASHVAVPYNDFLEHGVEGGVAGIFFLITFYFGVISMAWKEHNTVTISCLVALTIMAMTNFVYSSIQPWLLLMLHTSFVTSQSSNKNGIKFRGNVFFSMIVFMFFIACASLLIRMTIGQMKLLEYKDCITKGEHVSDSEITFIENKVGTSEAYWTIRAYNHLLQDRYLEATKDLSEGRTYASTPQIMEMTYLAYRMCDHEEQGIWYIKKINNMIPCLLRSKLLLMQYHDKHGNTSKAIHYAREIIACHVKTDNDKTNRIRFAAYDYIISHK